MGGHDQEDLRDLKRRAGVPAHTLGAGGRTTACHNYELVTSQYVTDEAAAGDPVLAAERLQALDSIPLVPLDLGIGVIAKEIMLRAILPPKATVDALHIAAVAHHRIEYLLTWNCSHIANAKILPRIHELLRDLGIPIPIICTPEEMVGDGPEEE